MTTALREGAICAALMILFFAALMIPGFWLRFGAMPWEMFP